MFPSLVEKLELVVVHYLRFVVHGSAGGFLRFRHKLWCILSVLKVVSSRKLKLVAKVIETSISSGSTISSKIF